MGIFKFDILENGDRVNVTLHNAEDVTYSIMETTSSKIVIQAEKNRDIQTLELMGDRVEAVALNSINIFVNFA